MEVGSGDRVMCDLHRLLCVSITLSSLTCQPVLCKCPKMRKERTYVGQTSKPDYALS